MVRKRGIRIENYWEIFFIFFKKTKMEKRDKKLLEMFLESLL